ncbi:hypothetical protein EYF80_061917 [Liparis tanakae]|uniref:Uncharacterized protein n=1 Tax=Liparis tanakae TaxID=230148 RepID=A0A4Z2EHI9_9TELE|nr:hypothetical protein EYF80_061917 [Liparis tanakae]
MASLRALDRGWRTKSHPYYPFG